MLLVMVVLLIPFRPDMSYTCKVASSLWMSSAVLIKPRILLEFVNCMSVMILAVFPRYSVALSFPEAVSKIFTPCAPFVAIPHSYPSGLKVILTIC